MNASETQPSNNEATGPNLEAAESTEVVAGWWREADGSIAGILPWPQDPVFRPVIGIFQGSRLTATVATTRWKDHALGPTPWLARFKARAMEFSGEDLLVTCLESGHALPSAGKLAATKLNGVMRTPGIAHRLRTSRQMNAALPTGFRSFLNLNIEDQLRILYIDYLFRDVDVLTLEYLTGLIRYESRTILDIRDELLSSAEFRTQKLSISDRPGRWTTWNGMAGVVENFATQERLGILGIPSAGNILKLAWRGDVLPAYCARLALGADYTPAKAVEWIDDHQEWLEALTLEVAVGPPHQLREPFLVSGLQSLMRTTGSGCHDGETITNPRGQAGIFAHGPYIRLDPGHYQLTGTILRTSEPSTDSYVGLEAVSQDMLIRSVALDLGAPGTLHQLAFEFEVDRSHSEAADNAFEFRFTSNGADELTISNLGLRAISTPVDAEIRTSKLLPFMSLGRNSLLCNGQVLAHGPGHALFGPYRQLAAGVYEVDAVFAGGHANAVVKLEVLRGPETISTVEILTVERASRIEARFVSHGRDAVYEFRLTLPGEGSIVVAAVNLRTISLAAPKLSAPKGAFTG